MSEAVEDVVAATNRGDLSTLTALLRTHRGVLTAGVVVLTSRVQGAKHESPGRGSGSRPGSMGASPGSVGGSWSTSGGWSLAGVTSNAYMSRMGLEAGSGQTPLIAAVSNSHSNALPMALTLLAALPEEAKTTSAVSAALDAGDLDSQWTALHHAVARRSLLLTMALISAGASLTVPDSAGLTPLDLLHDDLAVYLQPTPSLPRELFSNANASEGWSQSKFDDEELLDAAMAAVLDGGDDDSDSDSDSRDDGDGQERGEGMRIRRDGTGNGSHDVRTGWWSAEGNVYSFGFSANYCLGLTDDASRTESTHPRRVEALSGRSVVMVAACHTHCAAVTQTGELWTWGVSGSTGRLGHAPRAGAQVNWGIPEPSMVGGLRSRPINYVTVGPDATGVLTTKGEALVFGAGSSAPRSVVLAHGDAAPPGAVLSIALTKSWIGLVIVHGSGKGPGRLALSPMPEDSKSPIAVPRVVHGTGNTPMAEVVAAGHVLLARSNKGKLVEVVPRDASFADTSAVRPMNDDNGLKWHRGGESNWATLSGAAVNPTLWWALGVTPGGTGVLSATGVGGGMRSRGSWRLPLRGMGAIAGATVATDGSRGIVWTSQGTMVVVKVSWDTTRLETTHTLLSRPSRVLSVAAGPHFTLTATASLAPRATGEVASALGAPQQAPPHHLRLAAGHALWESVEPFVELEPDVEHVVLRSTASGASVRIHRSIWSCRVGGVVPSSGVVTLNGKNVSRVLLLGLAQWVYSGAVEWKGEGGSDPEPPMASSWKDLDTRFGLNRLFADACATSGEPAALKQSDAWGEAMNKLLTECVDPDAILVATWSKDDDDDDGDDGYGDGGGHELDVGGRGDAQLSQESSLDIPVHSLILAASSEYFNAALITSTMHEATSRRLVVRARPSVVRAVIGYMYDPGNSTGVLDADNAVEVLALARSMLMPALAEAAEEAILPCLDLRSAPYLSEFAESMEAPRLSMGVAAFQALHLDTLLATDSLRSVSTEQLQLIEHAWRAAAQVGQEKPVARGDLVQQEQEQDQDEDIQEEGGDEGETAEEEEEPEGVVTLRCSGLSDEDWARFLGSLTTNVRPLAVMGRKGRDLRSGVDHGGGSGSSSYKRSSPGPSAGSSDEGESSDDGSRSRRNRRHRRKSSSGSVKPAVLDFGADDDLNKTETSAEVQSAGRAETTTPEEAVEDASPEPEVRPAMSLLEIMAEEEKAAAEEAALRRASTPQAVPEPKTPVRNLAVPWGGLSNSPTPLGASPLRAILAEEEVAARKAREAREAAASAEEKKLSSSPMPMAAVWGADGGRGPVRIQRKGAKISNQEVVSLAQIQADQAGVGSAWSKKQSSSMSSILAEQSKAAAAVAEARQAKSMLEIMEEEKAAAEHAALVAEQEAILAAIKAEQAELAAASGSPARRRGRPRKSGGGNGSGPRRGRGGRGGSGGGNSTSADNAAAAAAGSPNNGNGNRGSGRGGSGGARGRGGGSRGRGRGGRAGRGGGTTPQKKPKSTE